MDSISFFSVLLPTKNRAHIVGYAIQSILNQSFEDFDIVLVDNDDTDATANKVKSFKDSRIRYFRTGSLNMVENWSFALSKARGQYVTVLEDKQAYYPDALKTLAHVINDNSARVVVWGLDVFNEHLNLAYKVSHESGVQTLSSDEVLQAYVNNSPEVWRCLPRMLNSCASMELIHEINAHPKVENYFSLMSPDLCAAFYQLGFVDELSVVRQSLGLDGYFQLSNANNVLTKKKNMFEFFGKGDFLDIMLNCVPIKGTKLLHNLIYNDYLRVRKKIGGRLDDYEMLPDAYASMCLYDLSRLPYEKRNIDIFKAILGFMKDNEVPKAFLLLVYVKSICVRKAGEISWLSNLRDRLKKTTWKADNILEATITHINS